MAVGRGLRTEYLLQPATGMRAGFMAIGVALAALAGAGCTKCNVDCIPGYEPTSDGCSCHPVPDAGADRNRFDASDGSTSPDGSDGATDGGPLASCVPGTACGSGSTCIEGCPASVRPSIGAVGGICSVPGRDTCGCGVALDTCQTPGTVCLMPACCDYEGICVTPAERAAICARPEAAHFDCSADAGTSSDASALCPAPPFVGAGGCGTQPVFNPMASSLEIWIADASAPQGGWRLTLPFNGSSTAGSHTYAYKTGSLIGTANNGIVGDAFVDVDGKVNQIHFQFEGCPLQTGPNVWDWTPAFTITSMTCQGCADVHIGRHFLITTPTGDGGATVTFTADEPPRDCGDGVDLLQMIM
jgi:hypothetical protein